MSAMIFVVRTMAGWSLPAIFTVADPGTNTGRVMLTIFAGSPDIRGSETLAVRIIDTPNPDTFSGHHASRQGGNISMYLYLLSGIRAENKGSLFTVYSEHGSSHHLGTGRDRGRDEEKEQDEQIFTGPPHYVKLQTGRGDPYHCQQQFL